MIILDNVNYIFLFALLLTVVPSAWSYPSFVSYGYRSCVMCHFNGQGNGPLNDYGRALFSAEIASRSLYPKEVTDDELGERSGFLGKTPLPGWFRPGFKARVLWFQTDPGSAASTNRIIPMQLDGSVAILFDEQQKWIAVASLGYMATPQALVMAGEKLPPTYSREHYVRYNPSENWFFYAGFMDKVYGIRTADHTAFSRAKTGLAQNDQSHGFVIQNIQGPWEYTLNPFIGNLSQGADIRQAGAALMVEHDIHEKLRVGGAVLSSKNNYVTWNRAEGHVKYGYGHGNSLLFEFGLIQDRPISATTKTGAYGFLENLAHISRGYNFLSQIEYYNQTLSTQSPDQYRWTLGFLMFPAPRYEVRTTIVNGRSQSDAGGTPDQWQAQVQLHVSL